MLLPAVERMTQVCAWPTSPDCGVGIKSNFLCICHLRGVGFLPRPKLRLRIKRVQIWGGSGRNLAGDKPRRVRGQTACGTGKMREEGGREKGGWHREGLCPSPWA